MQSYGLRSMDEVAMTRHAYRAEVAIAVGQALAPELRWGRSAMPTLLGVGPLAAALRRAGADPRALLRDFSAITQLEASEGNWEGVMRAIGSEGSSSVAASAAAFQRHVAPSMEATATRAKAWSGWRTVLTWATARGCLGEIMPMSLEVFQALTFDMLGVLCSEATVKGVWDSIQGQHRRMGQVSPMALAGGYGRLTRCIARFAGKQRALKYPIHRALVVKLLRSEPDSVVCLRDVLATVVATICCLRPSEGAALQVCDVWFDFDTGAGGRFRKGTAAINVMKRKNDQGRKGHLPRIGRSADSELDVVHQLKVYLGASGLGVLDGCEKVREPHARCACPALFPRAERGPGGVWELTGGRGSSSAFSEMVPRALRRVGASTVGFTGVSCRRGGLSTAIEAGVPKVALWMQSGHSHDRAARQYVVVNRNRPELLFKTFEAFGL